MDIKTILEGVEKLLTYIYGGQPPAWLFPSITWCVVIGSILWGVVSFLSKAQKIWTEFIQPSYYKPEDELRRSKRQRYAETIESEIKKLNTREAWNDSRFAELEAEVEAEGRRKLFDVFKVGFSPASSLRKEKSLSKALERSSERLILVEGDPGSGKSVALRHLAQSMSRKATVSRNLKSVIPLYINLKNLRHSPEQTIDQKLIRDFIYKALTSNNDRDVEDFLAEEFKKGLEEGIWLFLFDSFDEIPDILSSTEADNTIRQYAEAISDFLHGMNKCRGVVASREYKGPRFLGWPKFRILPLTLDRKRELIKRTNLRLAVQKSILNGIAESATDFRYLTSNPMFLNLLCEFMNKKEIPEFPKHTHHVFNDYVWKRLKTDEARLERFSKTPGEIRDAAERLAFCMTADTGIGLSPTLDQLETSTKRFNLGLGTDFCVFIDAITFLKLGHLEESAQEGNKYFTFAHRRFQEYFATAVVLREPDRVDVSSLLTNARWRETAVVILQTQSLEMVNPIFSQVHLLLAQNMADLQKNNKKDSEEKVSVVLPHYSLGGLGKRLFESFKTSRSKIDEFIRTVESFIHLNEEESRLSLPMNWPKNLFHILGILQEGLSTKYDLIPENIRQTIDDLLLTIMRNGSLDDRKWALEVAGCASLDVVEKSIDIGFSSPGAWVKNPAILQVSRLPQIPERFSKHIISNLFISAQEQLLLNRRYEIYAQFSRFSDTNYLNAASLIVWMPLMDFFLSSLSFIMIVNLIMHLVDTIQGNLPFIFSLIFVLFFSVIGVLVRWRSSSILKAIADTYSSRFGNYSRYSAWFSKRFRVKPPKHSDKSLSEKLMSLMMGIIFSTGGVLLFVFSIFNSKVYLDNSYIWLILLAFASFQLWPLAAVVEAFRLNHTSPTWRALYLFYPLVIGLAFPFVMLFYLADQLYLISRSGVALQVLKKSPIRSKFIPFIYSGNYYLELWMPISLIAVLFLVIKLINLATMAALWLVLILVFFEIFMVFYMFITPVVSILREHAKYKESKAKLKPLDVLHLVSIVEEFSTKRYRLDLIYTVLERQYLLPSSTNLSRLRILIAFLQTILASQYSAQNFTYLVEIDKELAYALGYVDQGTYKAANNWDEDQLDILCKMLEQLQQTSRKSA